MSSKIPNVVSYLHDILVTGRDDTQHLHKLHAVFQKLKDFGFEFKLLKCRFFEILGKYLSHLVDTQGQHATQSKVKDINEVRSSQNIIKLNGFLGLFNY